MLHPPIRRHPALIAFSRDHNVGLSLARSLRLASAGKEDASKAWRRLRRAWDDELDQHFEDEERLLLPLTRDDALADRLVAEHQAIRQLVRDGDEGAASSRSLLGALGDALHDHIRWEERAYFPSVEAGASESELEDLAARTSEMERSRPASRARPVALK